MIVQIQRLSSSMLCHHSSGLDRFEPRLSRSFALPSKDLLDEEAHHGTEGVGSCCEQKTQCKRNTEHVLPSGHIGDYFKVATAWPRHGRRHPRARPTR